MRIKVLSISILLLGAAFTVYYTQFTSKTGVYEPRNTSESDAPGIMGGSEYFKMLRANVNTGEFNPQDVLKTHEKIKSKTYKTSRLGVNWESLGPIDVGGRTRQIIVDKNDPDRFITGGVSGGIFISNNRGNTWKPIEGLPNLIVSTIDQGSDGTIYVGTGSRFEGSAPMPGTGIYKSTDGENYEVLEATMPDEYNTNQHWSYVNRLKVDPEDDDIVYAATNRGVFLTEDGGESWRRVFGSQCSISGFGPSAYRSDDIEILPSGRVLIGCAGGVVYSDNPTTDCTWDVTSDYNGGGRIDLAFCPQDPDVVYAVTVTTGSLFESGGFLDQIYKSIDGGLSWEINQPIAPSQSVDPQFTPFGSNGQGVYDLAIEVFPDNCDNILLGGVELWRVAGGWARIAETFAPKHSGIFVHADIHDFKFNPHNPNQLLIASDGGIGVTNNSRADQPQFGTLNRDYITTQFYDIDISPDGRVAGGTQDNGTIMLNPNLPSNAGKEGRSLLGGDGFGTRFSSLGDIAFATLYFNQIHKYQFPNISNPFFEREGSFDSPSPYAGRGDAPFRSVIELWESENDTLSRDSIVFSNDTVEQSLATLSSSDVSYSGTLNPNQPASHLIPGSILFRNPSSTFTQRIRDRDADGILYDQGGDSVGVFDYETYEFSLRFPRTPSELSELFVNYASTFNPGDTLRLRSNTLSYLFDYPLRTELEVGDQIKVQDPVQSILASVYNGGIVITREALLTNDPEWIDLAQVQSISNITTLSFAPDGDQLFAGTRNGRLYRVSGLRHLFNDNKDTPGEVVSIDQIFSTGGPIEGLAQHPTDLNKMLVAVAGYGNQNHVFELSGILSGSAQSRVVQGNLEDFPVYDAEYNVNDPSTVLIGTDFGMWSTSNIDAAEPEWSPENERIGRVPVFRVVQQQLPESQASNSGVFYAGTHGRGIWKTGDFATGIEDRFAEYDKDNQMNLKVYPNPVVDYATIEFELGEPHEIDIQIFDLNGKLVRNVRNIRKDAGKNQYRLNASDLPAGNYIAKVNAGSAFKTARFIVVK